VQHADDPRRALVRRLDQAELRHERLVGGQAVDHHRLGVRHVGEQRAHRHDELGAERLGEVDDVLAERAPAHRRLGALHEDEIARRARHAGGEDLDARPRDLAAAVLVEAGVRPRGLEVVEVLGVDAREALCAKRFADERQCCRGGVTRVVPTAERADEGGGAQTVGTTLPDQGLHPIQGTS
jgi:hypothetical protein